MIDVSFIQSEFQLSIATTVSPSSRIILLRRPLGFRIYDSFLGISRLTIALLRKKRIAIYDHRSLLASYAAFICKFFPSRMQFIFIGDDGMHSLIVDKYGAKHLYWRTKIFKKFILKKVESTVLSFKRIHALKDMTAYSAAGSIFVDYYSHFDTKKTLSLRPVIFIDQPGVIDKMNSAELKSLSNLLSSYDHIEVIAHPRRENYVFFRRLGIPYRKCDSIEEELKCSVEKIEIIGFFSTVLLGGFYFGHHIISLPLPKSFSRAFKEYSDAGLSLIN